MTPKAALAGRTWQALWARVLADQALAGLPTPFRTAGCVEPGKIASIIDRCIIFAVRPEQSSHEASGKVMYRLVAEIGKHEYLCALAREGASALVQPWSTGFDRIVERDQNLVEDWLDRILATAENQSLRQIHNLGVCLAAAYAARDGTKAAAVLRHLRHSIPVILILVGKERMSLYNYALFGAAETSVLNPLREDVFAGAFDDAALDAAVIAAESCGAGPWLDRYVERLLASSHPGDLARGLTVLGLRHFDDQSDRNLATFAGPGFLGQELLPPRRTPGALGGPNTGSNAPQTRRTRSTSGVSANWPKASPTGGLRVSLTMFGLGRCWTALVTNFARVCRRQPKRGPRSARKRHSASRFLIKICSGCSGWTTPVRTP